MPSKYVVIHEGHSTGLNGVSKRSFLRNQHARMIEQEEPYIGSK